MKAKKKKFSHTQFGSLYTNGYNLQDIHDEFIRQGFNSEDFMKVEFCLDFSDCYYPGESPNILFEYEEP